MIFDSTVPVGGAEAVYLDGVAAEAEPEDVDVFSRASAADGAAAWAPEDVRAPAALRLYRFVARERYVLGPGDERLPFSSPRP